MLTQVAQARALLDFGAIYFADTLNTDTSSSGTQYFYNANLMFNLDQSARWYIGWSAFGISQSNTASSVTTSYSSLDMGPVLRWNIDKAGIYSVSAAYGYLARGAYSSGATDETWEGGSLFGQFAILAPIRDEKLNIGVSLNYYSANYTKKVVNKVESSNSAQKSWVFPMVTLTWRQ